MCGFIVALARHGHIDRERLAAASRLLRHRGPDAFGEASWEVTCPDGSRIGIAIAHHRLSIIDPTARSDQPMRRGTCVLAYNGEIYNFRQLRADLAARGMQFATDGDSEVLLALLAERGVAGLAEANGMWAFCAVDETGRSLIAARDRYGKKPLFYYIDDTVACFASEIAPISTYLGRRLRFDRAALDAYLAHGWLFPRADARTHFVDIKQVTPGASLRFELATWTLGAGPALALEVNPPSYSRDGERDLAALLADAVRLRLIADRKIGLLLSGGIDSSLILSVLAHLGLAEQVQCYTGDAGKSEDARYAKAAAAAVGITTTMIPIDYGATSVSKFLAVCRHQEKPFPLIGNVLGLPQLYAAIAADDVPVVLDGTGADEIFGGYPERTYPLAVADTLQRGDQRWVDGLIDANADDPRVSQICRQARAHHVQSPERPILSLLEPATPEEEPDLRHLLACDVLQAPSSDPLTRFRGNFTDALILDATRGRMQEWLWQNDRTAMQAGVENRSPFLDHRLARYLATGPAAKLIGPWNKYELRTLFNKFRPMPTQWRRDKQGFRWVYGRFLRSNRNELLDLVAASKALASRLDLAALVASARRHDEVLLSELMQRSICIAGIEAELGCEL